MASTDGMSITMRFSDEPPRTVTGAWLITVTTPDGTIELRRTSDGVIVRDTTHAVTRMTLTPADVGGIIIRLGGA